ncbi:MAG: zinc ribbon domain-containing protein, partial [Sphaerospermopsis kisseleviana]
SKTCSRCGHKKENLSLSERIYYCENCGFEIDRDLNAAINLSRLAKA